MGREKASRYANDIGYAAFVPVGGVRLLHFSAEAGYITVTSVKMSLEYMN